MATVKNSATKKSAEAPAKKPAAIKPVKKSSKKNKGLIIGIIAAAAAVVIAAIAIVLVFIFSRPNLVGTYKLTGIERNGEDQSNSISILESLGMSATMELKDDKSGSLDLFGEKSDLSYDNKSITINGASSEFEFKDGKLSMEQNGSKLIFTKE